MPPTIVIQCYCLDDVNFYISTVCIPPDGIKKLQDIPGTLADSPLRRYYFPFACWDKVESTLLSLNPPRRMSETVLSSDSTDVQAQNPENEARSRAVSDSLKNLRKPSEKSVEEEKLTQTKNSFVESELEPSSAVNKIQQQAEASQVAVLLSIQENVEANLEKEKPRNSVPQTQPDSTSRQDVAVQIMCRDRFFIELEQVPLEAYPLLQAKPIDGICSAQAKLFHFSNTTYPLVVQIMWSLKPSLHLMGLPQWKPGLGICLSEGTTNRRVLSCPGNLKCYLHDWERFCVDYESIPSGALSLLGNIDVRLSGLYCTELMWHFPKDHHAAVLKALEIFVEIKDNPSMKFMLEPTVITLDGSICASDGCYGRMVMIPVKVMNFERFYIEHQHVPLSCFAALSKLKGSHNDQFQKRWHFNNGCYYAVKSIFSKLTPPVLLGYVPPLTKEVLNSKGPSNINGRALALLKMPNHSQWKPMLGQPQAINSQASTSASQCLEISINRIGVAPSRDQGTSGSGSQTPVLRNSVQQDHASKAQLSRINPVIPQVCTQPQQPEINNTTRAQPPQVSTVVRTVPPQVNTPRLQAPQISTVRPQPLQINTARPQPPQINTSRPQQPPTATLRNPLYKALAQFFIENPSIINTIIQQSRSRINPVVPEVSTQRPHPPQVNSPRPQPIQVNTPRPQPPHNIPRSQPPQINTLRPQPPQGSRPPEPTTNPYICTYKIEKIPGFAIVQNLTNETAFYRKSNVVYSAQIRIQFPPRPNNMDFKWGVFFRLAHSIRGALAWNRNLKLKMTILTYEKIVQVPVPKHRGLRFHLNITDHISWNQENIISLKIIDRINWIYSESTFSNFIGIVRHLDSNELLGELRLVPPLSVENTKEMVKDILENSTESGISTDDAKLTLSLKCPLGKTRIVTPCKSIHCSHCNCFDASNFFKMYEGSDDWKCPICTSDILMDDLRIDGFLEMILGEADKEPHSVDNDIVKIDAFGNFTICSTGQTNQIKDNVPAVIDVEDGSKTSDKCEYKSKILCQDVLSDSDDSIVMISNDTIKTEKTDPLSSAANAKERKSSKHKPRAEDLDKTLTVFLDGARDSKNSDEIFIDSELDPAPAKKKQKLATPKLESGPSSRPVCGCMTDCKSKRCACRKNNLPCAEMCHKNNTSECMNHQ